MSANREEDKKINEMYLNQDAIGLQQQRDPNKNLRYPPKYDTSNSNRKQFAGLIDGTKVSDARAPSSVDRSSDEEKERFGYILDSEQTKTTPENPEIVVVGLYKTDLVYLQKNILGDLEEMVSVIEPTSKYPELGVGKVIHRVTDKNSAFIHKCKALKQVLDKMDTPQYKRKITLAKQKRSRYNIKYGD